jgi:hypothetical protein
MPDVREDDDQGRAAVVPVWDGRVKAKRETVICPACGEPEDGHTKEETVACRRTSVLAATDSLDARIDQLLDETHQ